MTAAFMLVFARGPERLLAKVGSRPPFALSLSKGPCIVSLSNDLSLSKGPCVVSLSNDLSLSKGPCIVSLSNDLSLSKPFAQGMKASTGSARTGARQGLRHLSPNGSLRTLKVCSATHADAHLIHRRSRHAWWSD
jgi:hypothetical protein